MVDRVRLKKDQKEVLIDLYKRVEPTVDDLPYTDDFEILFIEFVARTGLTMTRHDVWRALSSLRKAKKLIRKQR
jgi:hypothetical protein